MGQYCYLCREYTGWYVWSSGRDFPRDKLASKINLRGKDIERLLVHTGKPICMRCRNMLDD